MFDLSPKAKRYAKKTLKLLPLIVLGLVLGWFLLLKPTLSYFEKKRFESAFSELQIISADIQSKIGPADSVADDSSCGRANMKNTQGPLSCNVGIEIEYVNLNVSEANDILRAIASMHDYELRNGPLTTRTYFEETDRKSPQIIYQSIDKMSSMGCSISYELRQNIEGVNKTSLRIIPHCRKSALDNHYPIR